jgi:hypothetical protein
MKALLFETFQKMINSVPAKMVRRVVETERLMLEEDLLYKRVKETREVDSLLSFCQFIRAVAENDMITPMMLPARHFACYWEIVKRLIKAGELSANATLQFDLTFSSGFSKTFAC